MCTCMQVRVLLTLDEDAVEMTLTGRDRGSAARLERFLVAAAGEGEGEGEAWGEG